MYGLLHHDFRQGHRSEYLANYILSALGIVVKVPIQEDIGTDFYCSIAKSLFKKFSYPILKPCTSSSQKEKAMGISKALWLALVTDTDSQDNIYNLLQRIIKRHDDAIGLGSLYFFKKYINNA